MKYTLFIFLLITGQAFAYTNFIGHGYTSCLNCHYSPFGGGPLNDYGRVISATAISSRAFYPKSWDEEKIAYTSGFLFRKPVQERFRSQINYRGFQLVRNPGSGTDEVKQWINMQADVRAILKFGENDKFIAVANYGFSPAPNPPPPGDKQPETRSREHYIGYRFTPQIGVYAGLMDKVFGLKVIEHIAYSRTNPQIAQNDQVHGVATHYVGKKWEGGLHGFAGNLGQDEELRMKGGSFMLERTVFDTHRLGASFLNTRNNFLELSAYSAHGRFNLKEGSALLTEIGQTQRKTKNGSDDRSTRYGLLQTYLRPMKGLYVLSNIEYNKQDLNDDGYSVRWGPGVQYFPIQRLELRVDIYNTRNFSPDAATKDTWMYLLQTHLWF